MHPSSSRKEKDTVKSLLGPAVLLNFEHSQRPILLSKFKMLTNTAGKNKGRVQITILLFQR